jgi:hypothetical protein
MDEYGLKHTKVFVDADLISLHPSGFNSQGIRQVGREVGIHGRDIPERLSTVCLVASISSDCLNKKPGVANT